MQYDDQSFRSDVRGTGPTEVEPTTEEPTTEPRTEEVITDGTQVDDDEWQGAIVTRSLEGYIDVDRSADISVDLVVPKPPTPLEASGLTQRCLRSWAGDRFASMIVSQMQAGQPSQQAVFELLKIDLDSKTNRLVTEIAEALESGSSLSEAMRESSSRFGKLLIKFVELGENGAGMQNSLEQYLDLRKELNSSRGSIGSSRQSRCFALTAGTHLALSGDVPAALRAGALERSKGFRKGIADAIVEVHAGVEVGEALAPKRIGRRGFQQSLINAAKLGDQNSRLAEMLLEYGRS